MNTVSVIIPVFDGETYLADAIGSVLGQTMAPGEIIVVDDGSGDRSVEVAEAFGSRVRVLRQPRSGPAAARNRGVASSTCALIAFLDADDIWLPDKLALQLAAIDHHEMVFGHIEHFLSADFSGDGGSTHQGAQPGLLPTTFIGRATLFDTVGALDESLWSGEFIEWLARCRTAGAREALVPETVARRRVHAANHSRNPGLARDYLKIAAGRMREARQRIEEAR